MVSLQEEEKQIQEALRIVGRVANRWYITMAQRAIWDLECTEHQTHGVLRFVQSESGCLDVPWST